MKDERRKNEEKDKRKDEEKWDRIEEMRVREERKTEKE